METEALLATFNRHVDQYSQHREYIRRARVQASRFSTAVIEKVVLDHSIKASAVADEILPHVPQIEARMGEIDGHRDAIHAEKASSDERMEELTLRQAIGEITDAEFDEQSFDLREALDSANARLEALSGERDLLSQALDRWVALAEEGEQVDGRSGAPVAPAPTPAPAPAPAAEARPVVEEPAAVAAPAPEPEVHDEPVVMDAPIADGQHANTAHITEDLSAVFQEPSEDADPGEIIEAGDAEVDFGVEVDEGPSAAVEAGGSADVEVDLGGAPGMSEGDEIGIDLDGVEGPGPSAEDGEDTRRALLLYQEGTPDEQIYPFAGDKLTIGRGRDNDIQIKNDSKVSRFHCRLFKRAGNYYVEDNKSSNGTLVNGELITERRLFGGEEVIIGETFFRFRIM
jgi:predicted component of type VI protein secretion system